MDNKIHSLRTLKHLAEIDTNEPLNKELALLFVTAMNDWPTNEHHDIAKTLVQFKEFFGDPFTPERANLFVPKWTPETLQHWAWRLEAGASLYELITLSCKHLKTTNIDAILTHILTYYEQEFRIVDFIATIIPGKTKNKYLHFSSEIRATIMFEFSETETQAMFTLTGREFKNSVETNIAKIKLLTPKAFNNTLAAGTAFTIINDGKVTGQGKITNVINSNLEQ